MATLDDNTSPFTDTKAQKIFKNTANLTLKGNTFDANHLDSFLSSQYCSKPESTTFKRSLMHINDSRGTSQKKGISYTLSSSMVRPSVAFISLNREAQTQPIYIDQYDGPSSLQKSDSVPTMKDQG